LDIFDKYKKRINNISSQDDFLVKATNNYNKYLEFAPNSFLATTRGKDFKLTLIDVSDYNKKGDEKYITTTFDTDIVTGDIVVIDDLVKQEHILQTQSWIVYDRENLGVPSHKKLKVKPINYILRFLNNVNHICSVPCVKNNQTMYTLGTSDSKYMIDGNTKMSITIQDNECTKSLVRDKRLLIDGMPYKISNIKKDIVGVLEITCGEDKESDADDLENGIADRWLYETKPNYTFEFPSEVTFTRYEEVRFDFIKNNGVIVNNPTLVKSSSNTSVVSYQSNQWICTGYGTSNFTITYQGIDKIYTNVIKVNVVQAQPITYTYIVTSNDGIFNLEQYVARIYTCNRFENGKGVPSKYNITIDYNGHSSNLISIENITDNGIQIRNNTGNGQVIYIVFKDIQTNRETRQAITLLEF